jgi:AraC-like DNA-binding protein
MKKIEFERTPIKGIEIKRGSCPSYKEHLHEELSIGLIEKGSTVVELHGEFHPFSEGDAILIPPYVSHICRPDDIEHWQFVMMYVDPSYYDGEIQGFVPRKLSGAERKQFIRLLEFFRKTSADFDLENALVELLISCSPAEGESKTNRQEHILKSIQDYIKTDFRENITLASLESMFHINRFSIIRGFRLLYNTTPSSFQLQRRAAFGKKLLAGGMSILDACSEAGFYDQAHFTREFKKAFGITPFEYRKSVAE